jgi:hypothetical protein
MRAGVFSSLGRAMAANPTVLPAATPEIMTLRRVILMVSYSTIMEE